MATRENQEHAGALATTMVVIGSPLVIFTALVRRVFGGHPWRTLVAFLFLYTMYFH